MKVNVMKNNDEDVNTVVYIVRTLQGQELGAARSTARNGHFLGTSRKGMIQLSACSMPRDFNLLEVSKLDEEKRRAMYVR